MAGLPLPRGVWVRGELHGLHNFWPVRHAVQGAALFRRSDSSSLRASHSLPDLSVEGHGESGRPCNFRGSGGSEVTTDRTVHARYPNMEIVRYDRAGKWYLEPTISRAKRQRITLADAVAQAAWAQRHHRGEIFFGRPGGMSFDRKVKASGSR
jgi:hypothetical protein